MARDLETACIAAWQTCNRVTVFLLESLSDELWGMKVPGTPHKTIQMLGGHLHNTRCMWVKRLGASHGVGAPGAVDRRRVSRTDLVRALERSSEAVVRLLGAGLANGGRIDAKTWGGPPKDVMHVLLYLANHEAHHRGQIILAARQLGRRLPESVTEGVWQWSTRAKEARNSGSPSAPRSARSEPGCRTAERVGNRSTE